MDAVEKQLAEPVDNQEACVMNLLKSVSEVRINKKINANSRLKY